MSSLCMLGNYELTRLDCTIPPWGRLTADCQLQGSTAPAVGTQLQLTIAGTSRTVTVAQGAAPYEQPRVRVVGGADKWDFVPKTDQIKDYGQVSLSTVARDLLVLAGEKPGNLSALSNIAKSWQTYQERAIQGLARVFRRQPALDLWCERDGTFSARTRPFSTTVAALARGVLPHQKQVLVFVDEGAIEPGVVLSTLYGDYRIERVQYELEPQDSSGQLTARCWYE